ncbi:MAG TPA: MerR family transcriptional regulator, partial [Acidimicrobiia bacterium]
RRGVEARHLRMYRTNAEREAVLLGQVLMPYVRQRNPEDRTRLQEELVELATLGRRLRTVLLREAVRESLAE